MGYNRTSNLLSAAKIQFSVHVQKQSPSHRLSSNTCFITTCLRAWDMDEKPENVALCFTDFPQRGNVF